MTKPDVTLQINLSPGDWRHASCLLPHQMRAWKDQVAEVLLVIDLHRSSGRFSVGWEEGRDKIMALARSIKGARVETVDYGDEARARVSSEFFGNAAVPEKDFRGGPYYAYFFGLNAASHGFVFHIDSDIFFGGEARYGSPRRPISIHPTQMCWSRPRYPGLPPRIADFGSSAALPNVIHFIPTASRR